MLIELWSSATVSDAEPDGDWVQSLQHLSLQGKQQMQKLRTLGPTEETARNCGTMNNGKRQKGRRTLYFLVFFLDSA